MRNAFIIFFLLFIMYSFLGWLMEVILTLICDKKFVNRGFLIGPYCPIYGYGVLGILFLIGDNTDDVLAVFLKAILISGVLEYLTSYAMEKIFKARWWDYSKRRFNINGRVCLETLIPFGILGTLCFYILNPFFVKFLTAANPLLIYVASFIFLNCYVIDNIVSFNVMNKIKLNIKSQKIDSTEKIRANVLKWLEKNSIFYKHIKNAYPNFKIKTLNFRTKYKKF